MQGELAEQRESWIANMENPGNCREQEESRERENPVK